MWSKEMKYHKVLGLAALGKKGRSGLWKHFAVLTGYFDDH